LGGEEEEREEGEEELMTRKEFSTINEQICQEGREMGGGRVRGKTRRHETFGLRCER
jgi:hypothetical protein